MASECPYDFTIVLNKYHKEDFFQIVLSHSVCVPALPCWTSIVFDLMLRAPAAVIHSTQSLVRFLVVCTSSISVLLFD